MSTTPTNVYSEVLVNHLRSYSKEDKVKVAIELLKSIRGDKDLPFGIGLEMTINWVEYLHAALTDAPNLFECWAKLLNNK